MMNTNETTSFELTPERCIRLLWDNRRVWMTPAIVCGVLATAYALVMTRYWEAHQGLLVRDEASSSSSKQPGEFADLYEMRTFQETLFELAKSHQVVTATLKNVASAEKNGPVPEPDARQVQEFRKRLSMTPPNGAEFGKTEVFYFSVKDPDRERATRLVAELCRQLSLRLGEIRKQRSESLVKEFEKQVELARKVHQEENSKLKEFESKVGPDLGELRLLHSATGGQSDLRQQLVDLEKESRTTEARLREAEDLLIVLQAAQDNPDQLIAMPNSLLKIQPTLQRLKDGLVDAQLQASRLIGTRTEDHPQVKAALDTVRHIREELHNELAVVIQGLQVEVGLSQNRADVLNQQLEDLRKRLMRLAEYRAEYSSRVTSVETGRSVLNQSRKQLNEVRAKQAAAQSAQLVTPIDSPETGPYPIGLGRTMVVLLGTFGGLVLGVGWLFLNLPTEAPATPLEVKKTTRTVSVPPSFVDASSAFEHRNFSKKPADPVSVTPRGDNVSPVSPATPVMGVPIGDGPSPAGSVTSIAP